MYYIVLSSRSGEGGQYCLCLIVNSLYNTLQKTALSFYHWSKDAGQNGKNGVILLPLVEGCEAKWRKRRYPSTIGRRMRGKMAKTALSFYHWSKDVRQNGKNGVILLPSVEGCEGERKDGEERWRRKGGEMIIPWGKRGNNRGERGLEQRRRTDRMAVEKYVGNFGQ